jgi:hypothetical protein
MQEVHHLLLLHGYQGEQRCSSVPKAIVLMTLFRIRIRIHLDPHSIDRIWNADPDPGGLKRAKMNKKTQLKDI